MSVQRSRIGKLVEHTNWRPFCPLTLSKFWINSGEI
jgi:hypothetical protein